MAIAAAIVLAMVLFLIDRNHAWPAFLRWAKRITIVTVALLLLGVGYYWWDYSQGAKRSTVIITPDAVPSAAQK